MRRYLDILARRSLSARRAFGLLRLLFVVVSLVIVVAAAVFIAPVVLAYLRPVDAVPPAVSLSLQVDGQLTNERSIQVGPGTTITPIASATDNRAGPTLTPSLHLSSVRVVLPGDPQARMPLDGPISIGQPIVLAHEGRYTIVAEATDQRGNVGSDSIGVVVERRKKYEIEVVVSDVRAEIHDGRVEGLDVRVVVGAKDFDIKNIYRETLILWPIYDDADLTVHHSRPIVLAGLSATSGVRADVKEAEATFFDAGYWELHFKGEFRDRPLPRVPESFHLTGRGWEPETKESVNLRSKPFPAQETAEPVGELRRRGLLSSPQ